MKNITPQILGSFIPPVIDEKQHIFGDAIPFEILKKDAIWDSSPAIDEPQRKKFETYNCTGFNTAKEIRIYMKLKFGVDFNPSDRWIFIIAGTQKPGNDPHTVMEAIREFGLIPEEMLPFGDDLETIEEYGSFKGANKDACYAAAAKWKEKYLFMHDWVVTPEMPVENKLANMKSALQTSPLSLAVFAWYQNEKGVYIKIQQENHWTLMVSFPDFMNIKDSYDPFDKIVDQDILYCKRIYIEIKEDSTQDKPSPRIPSKPEIPTPCKEIGFWNWILKLLKITK